MRNLICTLLIINLLGCIQRDDELKNDNMSNEDKWLDKLTEEQYRVTRLKGTERPFTGIYDNFYEKGKYNCICCDSTLFDSESKFSSGCGWPSFYDIFSNENIKQEKDTSHNMIRTEVLCAHCDAHLGHVFNDGPPPTGLRYCINSVSLKFIPEK